jgi:hypothetical protein
LQEILGALADYKNNPTTTLSGQDKTDKGKKEME